MRVRVHLITHLVRVRLGLGLGLGLGSTLITHLS